MRIKKRKLIYLLLITTLSLCASCSPGNKEILLSEIQELKDFSTLSFDGIGEVIIVQGDINSIVITAEPRIIHNFVPKVENDILYIKPSKPLTSSSLEPNISIKFHLTVKHLDKIIFSGAGALNAKDLTGSSLRFEHTGVGAISLENINYDRLDLVLAGGGNIRITGLSKEQSIVMSGTSFYNGEDMQSDIVSAKLSGNSTAFLWVNDTLTVDIRNNAHLSYYGFPQNTYFEPDMENIEYLGLR